MTLNWTDKGVTHSFSSILLLLLVFEFSHAITVDLISCQLDFRDSHMGEKMSHKNLTTQKVIRRRVVGGDKFENPSIGSLSWELTSSSEFGEVTVSPSLKYAHVRLGHRAFMSYCFTYSLSEFPKSGSYLVKPPKNCQIFKFPINRENNWREVEVVNGVAQLDQQLKVQNRGTAFNGNIQYEMECRFVESISYGK